VLVNLGLILLPSPETGTVDPDQFLCCHVAIGETAIDVGLESIMEPTTRAFDGGRHASVEWDLKVVAGDSWRDGFGVAPVQLDLPRLFLEFFDVVV
jgi:hypothetical protein